MAASDGHILENQRGVRRRPSHGVPVRYQMRIRHCFLGLMAGALSVSSLHAQSELKSIPARIGDKAQSYYHYSVGHLYVDLAAQSGFRGENVEKAIENLKLALKADPAADFIAEELSDVYIQGGKIGEAVADAETTLKSNPNDLNARRILGRVYTRMLMDQRQGRADETTLKKAIDQFTKITDLAPKDVDSWLMLGRLQKISGSTTDAEASYKKALEVEPESEEAMTGLALVYADQGDNRRAADVLEKVTKKNPSMRALMALASTYEQMRDYDSAVKALERAYESSNENTDILRALAQDYLMSNQYDKSLEAYQKLLLEDTNDVASWLRVSQIYRQKRDFEKAREAQNRASAVDANGFEVRYNEVSLLEAEGKTPEAIALLEKLLTSATMRGNNVGERNFRVALLERLGDLRGENNDVTEALKAYREAAQIDPNSAPRLIAKIVELQRQNRDFAGALREIDEAKRFYPDNPELARVRAGVLGDVGRFDDAIKELKSQLNGNDDRPIYLIMSQVFEKKKDFAAQAKALDEAEKLSKAEDEKVTVYFYRGAALERQKKFDDAEVQFRKVLAIDADNASALNYLGYMFADRGVRLAEAEKLISKALEVEPNNGAYLDSLGWAYFRQQRYDEAEVALSKALQRYPKDPTIYDHLADVYAATGRWKEAVSQWERSVKEFQSQASPDKDPELLAKIEKKLESARLKLSENARPSAHP